MEALGAVLVAAVVQATGFALLVMLVKWMRR